MFEPLTPEEQKRFRPPCTSPQHSPPNMIVLEHPVAWVCPACGHRVVIYPNTVTCSVSSSRSVT